jgi:hypothetical protein
MESASQGRAPLRALCFRLFVIDADRSGGTDISSGGLFSPS